MSPVRVRQLASIMSVLLTSDLTAVGIDIHAMLQLLHNVMSTQRGHSSCKPTIGKQRRETDTDVLA